MRELVAAAASAGRSRAIGVVGGFVLSFIGMGLLWIGTRWAYQALMFLPFLLLAFTLARAGGPAIAMAVLHGALPLGLVMLMFRDRNDSHLMPMLVVAAWCAGILGGRALARIARGRSPDVPE